MVTMGEELERFVPTGSGSLVDDAPGWSGLTTALQSSHLRQGIVDNTMNVVPQGPICWKCRGSGNGKKRRRKEEAVSAVIPTTSDIRLAVTTTAGCAVCHGKGHLPPKQQEALAKQNCPGEITRIRQRPQGWMPQGPLPAAVSQSSSPAGLSHNQQVARHLLQSAEITSNNTKVLLLLPRDDDTMDVTTTKSTSPPPPLTTTTHAFHSHRKESLPIWLPQYGEQLCNLVGSWRILQRVASHRWTTDDLVTSYMAGRHIINKRKTTAPADSDTDDGVPKSFRYLDLGCGNGSVLLMTTWQLMTKLLPPHETTTTKTTKLTCVGIEARKEAVQLARRSIAFNIGDNHEQVHVKVHHGDFRTIVDAWQSRKEDRAAKTEEELRYDLITGTPPYFRVDFSVTTKKIGATDTTTNTTSSNNQQDDDNNRDSNNKKNHDQDHKIVRQAVINQGGMPTCKQSAPARCEFRGGIEAYCVAAAAAMHSQSIFCVCENWLNNSRVYKGAQEAGLVIVEVLPIQGRTGKPCPLFAVYVMRKQEYYFGGKEPPTTKVLECVSVRDDQGKWTQQYQKILEAMSIPSMPFSPAGEDNL
jgi:tRNA1Val (adenine37-N6)-methyltransferase